MNRELSDREELRRMPRERLRVHQLEKLNRLLDAILPKNRFYAAKFDGLPRRLERLEQLEQFPLTTKDELLGETPTGLARHLTFDVERYSRYHRTSGTKGHPMAILDTADDWRWWIGTWQYVLDAAGIGERDRVLMAFSFGPFIGFWSAHDAVVARGALAIPTGGMSSLARLQLIQSIGATVIFCTPSYALHLAEVARNERLKPNEGSVRLLVVAGEPGGSIPSVRRQIESAWGAEVHDHCGATEIGPWGFTDRQARGLVVNEAEFIAEFLPVEHTVAGQSGPLAELVLTTLGRAGAPVIRYRTGDLVRPSFSASENDGSWVVLDGGILGRIDDMIIVRGVNVYPSSIEQVIREFPEVDEFRLVLRKRGLLDHLTVEVENRAGDVARIAQRLQVRLGLNVDVEPLPLGSLPRSEGKSRRLLDLRSASIGGS